MMLQQLREAFPAVSAEWRPGDPFACTVCQPLAGQPPLVGAFDAPPIALRLAGRRLVVGCDSELKLGIVAPDVIAGEIGSEEFVVSFADAHTLVGILPAECCIVIADRDGAVACLESDDSWSAIGADDAMALLWAGPLFALGYGRDLAAATRRAQDAFAALPWQQAEQRLAGECHVAAAPLDDD